VTQPTLAFIGAGNMARAIIGGLLENGYPASAIWASEPDAEKLSDLETQGLNVTTDNNQAVSAADVVVLAVKPQIMKAVTTAMSAAVQQKKPLIVSVAAGIPVESLQRWMGADTAVVRCMPNTPALVQTGASGLFASPQVTAEQKAITDEVMAATGISLWVEKEELIDAVIAVSGSGPAYYFLFMEAMIAMGEKMGLSAEVSKQLTLQTAAGAAKMALNSDVDPAELRRRVTSPNGTTEQAILSFQRDSLEEIVARAMTNCSKRAAAMAEELGKD